MALSSEILGSNFNETVAEKSVAQLHQLSEEIFKRISTLNKWEHHSKENHDICYDEDDLTDDEYDDDTCILTALSESIDWQEEDGIINFFYGKPTSSNLNLVILEKLLFVITKHLF